MIPIVHVLVGLILLVVGGEWLTAKASRLASLLGVGPIIIGLTVVAFGTSMPEAFVSIVAAVQGNSDIALANVVGSNLFNLTFILGLSALVHPLSVHESALKREMPYLLVGSLMLMLFGWDHVISRIEGAILLVGLWVFLKDCFRDAKNTPAQQKPVSSVSSKTKQVMIILISLVLLGLGAQLFVMGAVNLARSAGLSELVIGLTLVAAGTSLPELVTSVLASIRKQDDIAVGNVTGSNLFNIFFIVGVSAMVSPLVVSHSLLVRDIPLMLGVSLLVLPLMRSGFKITRIEGVLLVCAYMGYICWSLIESA